MTQYLHYIVIGGFILFILMLQLKSFVQNMRRMNDFKNTFGGMDGRTVFSVEKSSDIDYVSGISYEGSSSLLLERIISSLNMYLANNRANVIDFQLLKDTVDRNCDSVEEDINTQTPIPLYLGLAGTMFGIIVGIGFMWISGSLNALLQQGTVGTALAGEGIATLLSCVAVAMIASIVGLALTTYTSYYFKSCKLKEEDGKNSFLTWMQAELLPKLSVDASDSLMHLTRNMMDFNQAFASNTRKLEQTLDGVNTSYQMQAAMIEDIRSMDVQKMATANVKVLRQLEKSTEKIERFNEYLMAIEGYTQTIQSFNEQFQHEAERLGVLEKIRDFFKEELTQIRHRKAEMAKAVADIDDHLRTSLSSLAKGVSESQAEIGHSVGEVNDVLLGSLRELKESSLHQLDDFKRLLEQQTQEFTSFLQLQQREFQQLNSEMQAEFRAQLATLPQTVKQLQALASLPDKLEQVALQVVNSNKQIVDKVTTLSGQSSALSVGGTGKGRRGWKALLKPLTWIMLLLMAVSVTVSSILTCYYVNPTFRLNDEPVLDDHVNADSVQRDSIVSGKDTLNTIKQP